MTLLKNVKAHWKKKKRKLGARQQLIDEREKEVEKLN